MSEVSDAAAPVSASDRPSPVESVQAPSTAADASSARVAPIDANTARCRRGFRPACAGGGARACRCRRAGGARFAELASIGTLPVAAPTAAIPAETASQPAVVAPEAQPAAVVQPQLAALAVPPRVEPQAFDPNEQIRALLLRLDCARLDARFDADSGAVSLSGRLSSEEDQRALVEQISAIAGIRRVEASTLKVLGKPYCEILDLLNRPELAKSDELRHDVTRLGDANVPEIQHLAVGAPLNLSFHAPDFASYIYVVYLSSDGQVSHLLPASSRPGSSSLASNSRSEIKARAARSRLRPRWASTLSLRLQARSRFSSSRVNRASR